MSLEEVRNYLNTIRRDFSSKPLDEHSVKDNPLEQYFQIPMLLVFQLSINRENLLLE